MGVEDVKAVQRGKRDYCAFVVVGLHRKGYLDVLDVSLGKWEAEGQAREWWRLDDEWWCAQWGVEDVRFSVILLPLHRKMMELENQQRARRSSLCILRSTKPSGPRGTRT